MYSSLVPMFYNMHEKNQEGLVDFGDVMDAVMMCNGMNNYRAAAHPTVTCGYSIIIHSKMRIITNHIHYVTKINQAFPIFLVCVEKRREMGGGVQGYMYSV